MRRRIVKESMETFGSFDKYGDFNVDWFYSDNLNEAATDLIYNYFEKNEYPYTSEEKVTAEKYDIDEYDIEAQYGIDVDELRNDRELFYEKITDFFDDVWVIITALEKDKKNKSVNKESRRNSFKNRRMKQDIDINKEQISRIFRKGKRFLREDIENDEGYYTRIDGFEVYYPFFAASWDVAEKEAKRLKVANHSRWRLPTVDEAKRILKKLRYVISITSESFWTSEEELNGKAAYVVNKYGDVLFKNKNLPFDVFYIR